MTVHKLPEKHASLPLPSRQQVVDPKLPTDLKKARKQAPYHQPLVPVKNSLNSIETDEITASQTVVSTPLNTILQDLPGDLGSAEAAAKIVSLRAKKKRGEKVTKDDLFSFSKLTNNNKIDLLLDRDVFREGFFPAIAEAKESIHIVMLVFRGKKLGLEVARRLIEKKQNNPQIKIRVIMDALVSGTIIPGTSGAQIKRELKNAGIEVIASKIWRSGLEHRKIIVTDSRLALCGASYIADECFGNKAYWEKFAQVQAEQGITMSELFASKNNGGQEPFEITPELELPTPHDYSFRIQGGGVNDLQASFLQTWIMHGGTLDPDSNPEQIKKTYFPSENLTKRTVNAQTPLKISHSIPRDISEMRQNIIAAVNTAERSLNAEIAYIVIPEFVDSLVAAAKRGVKIKLLVNSRTSTNIAPTWYILRNMYPQILSEKNITLHEFKSFTHCKLIDVDNRLVFASTGNPEGVSWEKSFDEIMLVDDPKLAQEIRQKVIERDLLPDRSNLVTQQDLADTPWWRKIIGSVLSFAYKLVLTPREPKQPLRPTID